MKSIRTTAQQRAQKIVELYRRDPKAAAREVRRLERDADSWGRLSGVALANRRALTAMHGQR